MTVKSHDYSKKSFCKGKIYSTDQGTSKQMKSHWDRNYRTVGINSANQRNQSSKTSPIGTADIITSELFRRFSDYFKQTLKAFKCKLICSFNK